MAAVDAITGTITQPEIRRLGTVRKGFTPFVNNDVLFAKITPSMENGKAAIATDLVNGVGFGSTEFHVLSPTEHISPKWIFYYIRQSSFRADAKANFSGTAGQLRVPTDFLTDYPIPHPPLNEQLRIVAAIETQFTRLDAAVTALKRSQANLKRYRAAVLKAACEGRLVPTEAELAQAEGRPYEPASVLLERILAERRRKWEAENPKKKYQEPVVPDTSTLPELPEGWCWVKFENVITEFRSGTTAVPQDEPTAFPILRSSSVRSGHIDYKDIRYLSEADSQNTNNYLNVGDLLFTRLNGSIEYVGNCARVSNAEATSIQYPDRIFRATLILIEMGQYIEASFSIPTIRTQIMQVAKSTAGHQRVSMGDIKDILVPLPPLAEQQRIVAEVERRLSLIDQLEKTIEADLARANRLRQSILQRAFAGQLVPQDPNDEPASVLLELSQCAMDNNPVQLNVH